MPACYSHRCKFICPTLGVFTRNLHIALEWEQMGFDVLFYYNGKYVGELIYSGEFDLISELPDAPVGSVFKCRELGGFYITIPEKVLRSKPLINYSAITFSTVFVS